MRSSLVRVGTMSVAVGSLAVAAAACAGDGTGLDEHGNPVASVSECVASPGECADGACFARDIQPIFSGNCAFSGCHAGTAPQQGMNLSAGVAYANIMCVQANERPGMMRVRPLQPDSSYLVHKIQGTQTTVGGSGGQMPLGLTPLSGQQISLIRAWITEGAKNN